MRWFGKWYVVCTIICMVIASCDRQGELIPTYKPLSDTCEIEFSAEKALDEGLKTLFSLSNIHLDSATVPRSWDRSTRRLITDSAYIWTSGFYAGCLWKAYAYTCDAAWQAPARHYSHFMAPQRWNPHTHDLGFMLMNSLGEGWRSTDSFADTLIDAAETLTQRFDPQLGCIQSFDMEDPRWCPVIIDNLMNLELLFWASKYLGDIRYHEWAIQHADLTRLHHIRPDGSVYHVAVFDRERDTLAYYNPGQGKDVESSWSRGQAWAIYGFTMVYAYTGEVRFLEAAQQVANYWLVEVPYGEVPFWDFKINQGDVVARDASAAAIVAAGFLKLARYTDNNRYKEAAMKTLMRLSCPPYQDESDPFLLSHSTGSVPHGHDVDRPLIYADYYYLEALIEAVNMDL